VNKKAIWPGILVAIMLFVTLPAVVQAAVSLELSSTAFANDQSHELTISGASTHPKVNINIVHRDSGAIFYYHVANVIDGRYQDQIVLPSGLITGTYKVAVGIQTDIAAEEFVVELPGSGDPGGEDPGGEDPGGEDPGGEDPGGEDPGGEDPGGEDPDSGPDNTGTIGDSPPAAPVTERGSNVDLNSVGAVQQVQIDGRQVSQVRLDSGKLDGALKTARESSGEAASLTVNLGAIGDSIIVAIPSSTLLSASQANPQTTITLMSSIGGYALPVGLLDLDGIAKEWGVNPDALQVSIRIEKVTAATQQRIESHAAESGIRLLTPPIEFKIVVESDSRSEEINMFDGQYVSRIFEVTGGINMTEATGVLIDPETGARSFAPTYFYEENGKTYAAVKRSGNSVYAVVQHKKTFIDLDRHWAKDDVELLASKLVVQGVTEQQFVPDSPITRAAFTTLLVRSLGLAELDARSLGFQDVAASDWYAGSVAAAVEHGLVTGVNANAFAPDEPISREQMAVMIARALDAVKQSSSQEATRSTKFDDQSSMSSWAEKSVAQVVQAGIITGFPDGTFKPAEQATRAEAVVMLKRMLQFLQFMN
jgi:hypothetical protein